MEGTVKFFDNEKEFGFITGNDGKDYFVHKTSLKSGVKLEKADSVTFDSEKGDRGMKAVNVAKA
ncbi:MAG: cold shock domain-containing protein [Nanoarchaeota archaeon]|nr:cold shock domain-containing protein [Nanoarchaeota archaeon]